MEQSNHSEERCFAHMFWYESLSHLVCIYPPLHHQSTRINLHLQMTLISTAILSFFLNCTINAKLSIFVVVVHEIWTSWNRLVQHCLTAYTYKNFLISNRNQLKMINHRMVYGSGRDKSPPVFTNKISFIAGSWCFLNSCFPNFFFIDQTMFK